MLLTSLVRFFSAFNTCSHISLYSLSPRWPLTVWTMDFLTKRSQSLGQWHIIWCLYTSTGSPQGYKAMSFHPCSSFLSWWMKGPPGQTVTVKFTDDTVVLSFLSGPLHHHSSALHEFIEWCDKSCLELNVNKTKEMVVTFSNKQRQLAMAGLQELPLHVWQFTHLNY